MATKKAEEALQNLKEGNLRFLNSLKMTRKGVSVRKVSVKTGEKPEPLAAVVGCSDSRVSPEIIFDAKIGDLFVVRTAGNTITPEVLGSIELAVEYFDIPLIVVLGHEDCAAVRIALENEELKTESMNALISAVKLGIEKYRNRTDLSSSERRQAEIENVRYAIAKIRQSPLIEQALSNDKLTVVGAIYRLTTGKVEWLD